jgi:hypothetical protein
MRSKDNKPQRPAEIDKAVKKFRAVSRAELAKREVVQFRMDTDDLQKLFQVCALNKKPVGTLVRDWVIERTEHELSAKARQKPTKLEQDVADIGRQLNFMKDKFEQLEATINRDLNKRKSKSA